MSSVEARLRSALDELFEEVAKLRKEKHEWLKEKEGLQCENQALRNQLRADGAAHRVDGASLMDDEGGSEDEKKEDHSGSLLAYPKGDRVLEGHSGSVYSAVVSSDGRAYAGGKTSMSETDSVISAEETGVLIKKEQSSETTESLINSSEHEERSLAAPTMSYIDTLPMDEQDRWMIKVRMINRHAIRGLFGLKKSHKHGGFIDTYMTLVIAKYIFWIDYPKGDRLLDGHSKSVYCAAVSTDGRWLFTGSKDQSMMKWNLSDNTRIGQWIAHYGSVYCLAYGPSSLISGSIDRTLKVWNPYNLELVRTLVGHKRAVRSVNVNKRATMIVSGSDDMTIRLWSMMDGQCIRVLKGHSKGVNSAAFLNDYIVSASDHRSIKIWNSKNTSEQRTVKEGIKKRINDLSLNCDGSLVACMFGFGFSVYEWPKFDVLRTVKVRSECGCFHPCNPDILAVNHSHSLRIYLMSTGECIQSFNGHLDSIFDICFTPNGHRLISVSKDKCTRIWDTSGLL